MRIDESRLAAYRNDSMGAVRQLTADLRERLTRVTLNAPDWATLRFIHTARRLYKPVSAKLTPSAYVELSRRFLERYTRFVDEPDIQRLRTAIKAYQTRLEFLGLKDHQLNHPVSARIAMTRIVWRAALVILLLPLALPGAIIVLPIAWLAATVSSWYSYDVDDIATLKVTTAVSDSVGRLHGRHGLGRAGLRMGLGNSGRALDTGQFVCHAVCAGKTGAATDLDPQHLPAREAAQ